MRSLPFSVGADSISARMVGEGEHSSPLQYNKALCVNFIAPLLNCNEYSTIFVPVLPLFT